MEKSEENSILGSTWGNFSDLQHLKSVDLQNGRFSVHIDNGRFECLIFPKNEPRLFVLLSGARDPKRQYLPKFDRWSWHRKFPGSVICISDPTLYLAPDHLRIGWYVGNTSNDWMASLAGLVLVIAKKLDVPRENIVTYGSSAAGFASLMLSFHLGPSTAVAINPQIRILDYSRRFVEDFLAVSFEKRGPEQLSIEEKKRLSVIESFKQAQETKFVLVQNTLDRVHYRRHFGEFCKELGIDPSREQCVLGKFKTILYRSPVGHGAEPKEMLDQIINAALSLNESCGEKLALTEINFAKHGDPYQGIIKANQLYFPAIQDPPSLDPSEIVFAPHGRSDVAPIQMTLPWDWSANPFKDSNWCSQLQKWNMIDRYILAYELQNNTQYLHIAKKIMLDWYRHHIEMKQEGQMVWRDFTVGMRAMKIAYIVSQWLHGKFEITKKEESIFLHMIMLHLDFIMDFGNIKFTNHTFSDFHGAMALAQVIDSENRKLVEDRLFQLTPKLIESQFDCYGVHLEHSFGYQGFGIRCLQRLVKSGWFNKLNIKDLIARAEEVQEWFFLPDGRVAPIGDTNGQESPRNLKEVVFKGARQVFNSSGYCIVRSDGNGQIQDASYFCMMGAFNTRVHKHPDDLSIIWFEGEDILCDSGKFAYKSHVGRKYVQSTRAHNTVEIDDTDFSVESKDGYGSAIKEVSVSDWGYLVAASVNHKKLGVQHTRFCLYQIRSWLLIIDRLISDEVHNFTQWYHFAPHLNLNQTKGGFSTKLRSGRLLNLLYTTDGEYRVKLLAGETKPVLQGWISQGYAQLSPSQTLGICRSGREIIFTTLFCIGDEGSTLSMGSNNRLLLDLKSEKEKELLQIIPGNHSCRVKSLK